MQRRASYGRDKPHGGGGARRDSELSRVVRALEYDQDHEVPVEDWAALLLLVAPREYREPPPPATATTDPRIEARVLVYAQRARAGVSLWHPGDGRLEDADDRVGIQAESGRRQGGVILEGRKPRDQA